MGQSLVKNYLHIVFSTKQREPLITVPHEKELHEYLGGICQALECHPIIVGGYIDHVHILCSLSKKVALVELLQKVKSNSSKWMKTRDSSLSDFTWQRGYAAFSVNYKSLNPVIEYIKNQHQHHSKTEYKDEVRAILRTNDIEFDEKYIWD